MMVCGQDEQIKKSMKCSFDFVCQLCKWKFERNKKKKSVMLYLSFHSWCLSNDLGNYLKSIYSNCFFFLIFLNGMSEIVVIFLTDHASPRFCKHFYSPLQPFNQKLA
uniref:Uncharacterized protein n=1 Tax=Octopus bimaculoides TaxID=37653 RepID=A0A0L8ID90_OCTBM